MEVFYVLLLVGMACAIPGGWNEVDVDDVGVQDAANFGAMEIQRRSNSLFKSRLLTVLKAESQVVAGINYRLVVRLGELNCRRNEDKDPSACQVIGVQKCTLTVWSQPWLKSTKLTEFHCEAITDNVNRVHRVSELSVGGHRPVDVSEYQVRHGIEFVIKYLNSQSDNFYSLELFQVVNGTQQVVAGLMLHLKLELVVYTCEKSANRELGKVTECANNTRKKLIECDVEVLDQPWQDPRHVLHRHQCRPTGRAPSHRSASDGSKLTDEDPDVGTLDEFEDFKQKYGKIYSSAEEEQKRYQVFKSNMKMARQIQQYDLGTATYGASLFADLTVEEFSKTRLPRPWDLSFDERLKPATIPSVTPAATFDWRDHGAVTSVKNQGFCGSCWAFSVTGNIEGQWALKKKKLLSLSEQELVDCDKLDDGCNGGFPSNAYHEIQRLGGLETEVEYPYKGVDEKCSFVRQDARVYINGSLNISKNEDDMKLWLYQNGPMSIGINAFAMQFYLGGISHPWKIFCPPSYIDHGVAIVGYGVKHGWFSKKPYWIVKNSWGRHWGEKGYYLVYRGAGVCGLNQMVSSAIVD